MTTNTTPTSTPWPGTMPPAHRKPPNRGTTDADAAVEFGRFRVLLRRRQLLADGVPVELGTRAFDLLLVLLEADGLLVTKEELFTRVWPGIVVSEGNLKVHIAALRKALGPDRELIRTEFGRGYRFTGLLCADTATATDLGPCAARTKPGCDPFSLPQSRRLPLRYSEAKGRRRAGEYRRRGLGECSGDERVIAGGTPRGSGIDGGFELGDRAEQAAADIAPVILDGRMARAAIAWNVRRGCRAGQIWPTVGEILPGEVTDLPSEQQDTRAVPRINLDTQ